MDLAAILKEATTVAIVGCSGDTYRTSNHAAVFLAHAGYDIIPVNPKYSFVNGIPCLPDYELIGDDQIVDIVNVFRNPSASLGTVEAIIRRAARTGRKPVIWTQPGVSTPEAEEAASAAGFEYVRDVCIMVELAATAREG